MDYGFNLSGLANAFTDVHESWNEGAMSEEDQTKCFYKDFTSYASRCWLFV